MMCLAFAKAKGKKIAELETERESAAKDLATVRSDLRKVLASSFRSTLGYC